MDGTALYTCLPLLTALRTNLLLASSRVPCPASFPRRLCYHRLTSRICLAPRLSPVGRVVSSSPGSSCLVRTDSCSSADAVEEMQTSTLSLPN